MNWKTFPYATFCTLVFFGVGYFTGEWGKAWLIWLTIPIYNSLVSQSRSHKQAETFKTEESWSNL